MGKLKHLESVEKIYLTEKQELLKIKLEDFFMQLPVSWMGVENLCFLMSELEELNYSLKEIWDQIKNDQTLFFWAYLLVNSLHIEELHELSKTLSEKYPRDKELVYEFKMMVMTHCYEKLGMPTNILASLSQLPSIDNSNIRLKHLHALKISFFNALNEDLKNESSMHDFEDKSEECMFRGHA